MRIHKIEKKDQQNKENNRAPLAMISGSKENENNDRKTRSRVVL
jgi:hypothetical protein